MLGRIVIILSVAHHIHGFAPPPDKCPEPDKSWLFTGTGLFTGEGELQLQEGKPHGSFVFEKASNVIAFMDRPGREAHTMTLPEVARAFEGREESNPPNGVLTITMKHGTHEESMVSIPVTLETHTYYPEMDKMGFTYTILGHFTPRQIEALYCQQCPLSIFVDNLFRTLYTWATPAPLSGVDAFDPGSCCNAGLQKINDGTMVAGPCKEGGGCTPCSSAWLSNTYCKTGQYCMEASALKKNTCKDFTTAWGISKGDIACDPNRGTCECPLGMTPKVNDENPPSSNGCGAENGWPPLNAAIGFINKGFEACCDAHDICYGTPGSNFHTCNRNQLSCENEVDTVRAAANFVVLEKEGWDAFQAAQQASVKCV